MEKVLVTGADGFIGSHLTEYLLKAGYTVRALSQYNSFNSWGWLENIPHSKQLEVVSGDIRDPYFCRQLVEGIDIIFNLAALISIPYSYKAPASYVETNIIGTTNMCQAALENGTVRFIQMSSSETYGTAQYVPIDENHPKQPQSPYSASKIGSDAMALSYYYAFGLPVTIARPFNTYGPRQSARAIIPTVISQILSGQKEIRTGNLKPTRDLTYVTDTCYGLVLLGLVEDAIGKEINICSNFEISMEKLITLIKETLDSDTRIVQEDIRLRPKNTEVYRLFGDNSQLKAMTGFQPKISLKEGIKLTCNWFSIKENLARYKASNYNI